MDRRTKILASGFALVVAYALLTTVVYPRWIKPIWTIEDRIAERRAELAKLEALDEKVREARYEYREWVRRIGSFDVGRVGNDVRDRINTLIEKHKLQDFQVSARSGQPDRKTDVQPLVVTVQAVGTLESAIGFLSDVAELPQLSRVGNVAIYPASSSRRGRPEDNVNIRVPIELRVLPQQRIVGRIDVGDLPPPDPRVRHEARDYALIWTGTPFQEYVPPKPLHADAGSDQNVVPGRRLELRGLAIGGVGAHTYAWSPAEGLATPTELRTVVDTKAPGERVYTLTVTDERGDAASDSVTVTIEERRTAQRPPTRRTVPPPPVDTRWKNRRYLQVVMALGQTYHGQHRDELMLYDRRDRTTSYYGVGDEFDGGELLYVHQTGGLVRRKDEYFIYPIGAQLDGEIALAAAEDYSELRGVAERIQAADAASPAPAVEGPQLGDEVGDGAGSAAPSGAGVKAGADAGGSRDAAVKGRQPVGANSTRRSARSASDGAPSPARGSSTRRARQPRSTKTERTRPGGS